MYMSSASNLGYGHQNPYNTSPYVNGASSTYSGNFSSNEVPGCPGLAGVKNNVEAAASSRMSGGALRRKIKNIARHYKTMSRRKTHAIKRRIRRSYRSRSRRSHGSRRRHGISRRRHGSKRRVHHGGYSQYQSNMPFTPSYSTAGVSLPSSQSALANPPPITRLSDSIDNYNHYTNKGFPSQGH